MGLRYAFFLMILLTSVFYLPFISYGKDARQSGIHENIILTPADRMILDAINRVNERIYKLRTELNGRIDKLNGRIDQVNDRIDQVNDRIDRLWAAMVGGFIGVMAFIGGIVFWDRRTFARRVKMEVMDEWSGNRKKLDALIVAMRKLGRKFPEVHDLLNSFGLL